MSCYIDIHTHDAGQENGVFPIFSQELPSSPEKEDINRSVGWHPWHIGNVDLDEAKHLFFQEVQRANVVCVGECGLDRCIEMPIAEQIPFFQFQLEWAEKTGKPTIVHCVRAYSDLQALLKQTRHTQPIILHAFNGNKTQIEQLLKYNCFFSVGETIEKTDSCMSKILPEIPFDRLFLETDVSKSGIKTIYEKAANQLNINPEKLKDQIFGNFSRIFPQVANAL